MYLPIRTLRKTYNAKKLVLEDNEYRQQFDKYFEGKIEDLMKSIESWEPIPLEPKPTEPEPTPKPEPEPTPKPSEE